MSDKLAVQDARPIIRGDVQAAEMPFSLVTPGAGRREWL